MSTEDRIQELIDNGIGDRGRLEHILATIKAGRELYFSDRDYLEKLIEQTKKAEKSQHSDQNSESTETYNVSEQFTNKTTDTELLKEEIRKLKEKNHLVEEQLRNIGVNKRRTWPMAFGRGLAGITLFLFGLGVILSLYYYLTHMQEYATSMHYGSNAIGAIIMLAVVVPAILLVIGGSTMYYGIRIISKN